MNGYVLLGEFRKTRSEAAFRELVHRYTNLVYSAAKRRLSDPSLAEEVTQSVFVRLAESCPRIGSDPELMAWLHRTTVHVAIDVWRSESRRRTREEHVAAMQSDHVDTPAWNDLAPVLDDALNELNDTDRQTILLRFFDEKPMRDLGQTLGISEDAAKMRVSRALERLRQVLGARGVTCSAVVLAALLAEHSVEAAPATVAMTLAKLKAPAASAKATGFVHFLTSISKVPFAVGVAGLILLSASTALLISHLKNQNVQANTANAVPSSRAPKSQTITRTDINANATTENKEPDPRKLLHAVAEARRKVTSGEFELESSAHFLTKESASGTQKYKVSFSGSNSRVETSRREYRHLVMGDEAAEVERKIANLGLDQEGAVRAGLIGAFEAHRIGIYDGSVILIYEEDDGKPFQANIYDPLKGSGGVWVFDPRCLGLNTYLSTGNTLEKLFDYYFQAKAIRLVGEEFVDGVSAWHIYLQLNADGLDFWIDATHTDRVLKVARGQEVVTSKFDEANPSNPIPIEMREVEYRNGSLFRESRKVRFNSKFNILTDPATWTLAGLKMAVGTDVNDNRIHRRLGYWTGSGLSENLSNKKPEKTPDRAKLLALLDEDPTSAKALDAANWIMLNTPDGPDVEKAADIILRDHLESTNLLSLSQELQRMRPRCSRRVLEAILEANPDIETRASACFTLAKLLKDQADHGKDETATAEAIHYFERVTTEFRSAIGHGYNLAAMAKPELYELQHLTLGQPAPETEGVDLDGGKLRLNDFHGKVVVLVFWGHCGGCRPDMTELRKFTEAHGNQPVALLGVYSDYHPEEAKKIAEEIGFTWPSVREDRNGPIAKAWNNDSWPAYHVIDARGVIRQRHISDYELGKAVDTLLKP